MNNGKAKKTENSRLNLFYILQVLSHDTDAEHPMGAADIAKKINEEFKHLAANAVISADTVKRILEDLTLHIFPTGDVETMEKLTHRYGYFIYVVMKTKDGFCSYQEKEGKQSPKKYYYMERDLKKAELQTLKDAVEAYSYFSEEDIAEIISKLTRLRPQDFPTAKYYDAAQGERDENSLLLMNIDDLSTIIQHRNAARIVYCEYDTEKKLVPRPGYPKQVEPLHLMWSNGYYYLLAYNEKYRHVSSMRVDRITEIEEVELSAEEREKNHGEEFNPVQYRHEHPVMYGGEKEKIELLCRDTGKNHIMNTIVDVFGKNACVSVAKDALLKKQFGRTGAEFAAEGITWLRVTMEAVAGGAELWATQYCEDCVVLKPQKLAQRVKERLLSGISNYKS